MFCGIITVISPSNLRVAWRVVPALFSSLNKRNDESIILQILWANLKSVFLRVLGSHLGFIVPEFPWKPSKLWLLGHHCGQKSDLFRKRTAPKTRTFVGSGTQEVATKLKIEPQAHILPSSGSDSLNSSLFFRRSTFATMRAPAPRK